MPSALDEFFRTPPHLDGRRINVMRAKLMVEAINRHGGRAKNVMLPE